MYAQLKRLARVWLILDTKKYHSLFTIKATKNSCYTPCKTVFVGGYTVLTLSVRPSDRPSVRMFVRNVLFP